MGRPQKRMISLHRQSPLGLIALWLLAQSAVALGAPNDVARMERAIDLRVSTGQFAGAVLIAKGGKILINKGYGSANLDWSIPNSPRTRFLIGSVTKQFTAASVLLLEERGKLRTEDPIKKYLPEVPPAWDHITIFDVLTHTSGIPDFTEFPDFTAIMAIPTTPEQLVARFRDKALDFPPGSRFKYSNSGYELLGYLIEKISGEPYGAFVRDNLLTPLGMKESGYGSPNQIIPNLAVGYEAEPSGPVIAPYFDESLAYAAGGLYSTTGDLLRWERALYGGKVLSAASLQKMMTPYRDNYALGLGARKTPNGQRLFWHNGGIPGFRAWVGYVPEEDVDVIVLSNLSTRASQAIGNDLVQVSDGERATLISDRRSVSMSPDVLDRFSGYYRTKDDEIITVRRSGDHLIAELPGRRAIGFYPERKGDFFARVLDAQIAFNVNSEGQSISLLLRQDDTDESADRIDDTQGQGEHQLPAARSAAALRALIEGLEGGSPDFEQMTPDTAAAMGVQVDPMRLRLAVLGAVQSVDFEKALPFGAGEYRVKFEHGTMECQIRLGQNGKITDVLLGQQH